MENSFVEHKHVNGVVHPEPLASLNDDELPNESAAGPIELEGVVLLHQAEQPQPCD